MGTSLRSVMDMMMPIIPTDYKTDIADDIDLAYRGLVEMGIALRQDYTFVYENIDVDGVITPTITSINEDLTMSEKYLASHYAYRSYLMRLKDELNRDAINFKTLTFEIKSLEKRPEAINDSIYSLNRYLSDTVAVISGSTSLEPAVSQFGGTSSA